MTTATYDDEMGFGENYDDTWRPLSPSSDELYGPEHPFKSLPSPVESDIEETTTSEEEEDKKTPQVTEEETNIFANLSKKHKIRTFARTIRPLASRILTPEIQDYVLNTMTKANNDIPITIYECIAYMFIQASMSHRAEDFVLNELKRYTFFDMDQVNAFCDMMHTECPDSKMKPYVKDSVKVLRLLCEKIGVEAGIMNWKCTFGRP